MKKNILIYIFIFLCFILLFINCNLYAATSFEIAIFNDAVERAKSLNYDTSNYVIIKSPDSGDYNIFFVNDKTRTHWNSHLNCLYSYGNLFFYENNKLNSGRQIELGGYNNYCVGIPVFSSFDLYTGDNGQGDLILKKTLVTLNYEVHASITDYTPGPITLYTNYFDYEDREKYRVDISTDLETWVTMNYETMHFVEENITKFRFNYQVNQNGTYYFKFINLETSEEEYITFNVNNIISEFEAISGITPEITFNPNTSTDKPIIAWTNKFPIDNDCLVYFSEDNVNWTLMNTASQNDDGTLSSGESRFWTRIYKNGTYYFKFILILRDENGNLYEVPKTIEHIIKKEVNFIMVDNYMSDDYIFKPIISVNFNERTQSFIIRTQSIMLDKALNLNCFYTTYDKNNSFDPNEEIPETEITTWNKMDIDFENNIYMNTSDAYFYFEIPIINAEDTNYKIAFYNYFSNKSSEITYYDFSYNTSKDYVENDLKVHLGINVKLNEFLKTIEGRLGILGLPISVVRSFCNKILTLQEEEPIIYIPELYEPFYNTKFFNGISFNFNSLLVNDNVIFIHSFYLILVDMIFIYLFLRYCIKTLKSFIDNNHN